MQPNALLAWQNFITQKVGVIPTSSGFVLKMNSGYNEVSRELEKFAK
jgi:hypothetical protein